MDRRPAPTRGANQDNGKGSTSNHSVDAATDRTAQPGQCDRDDSAPHSSACRSGRGKSCRRGWCECACHRQPPPPREPLYELVPPVDCRECGKYLSYHGSGLCWACRQERERDPWRYGGAP